MQAATARAKVKPVDELMISAMERLRVVFVKDTYRKVKTTDDVEDIVQTAMADMWIYRNTVKGDSLEPWMWGVLRRHIWRYFYECKRRSEVELPMLEFNNQDGSMGLDPTNLDIVEAVDESEIAIEFLLREERDRIRQDFLDCQIPRLPKSCQEGLQMSHGHTYGAKDKYSKNHKYHLGKSRAVQELRRKAKKLGIQ